MPRRIRYALLFTTAAAVLAGAGWPPAPTPLATLANRIDVVVGGLLLAAAPALAHRLAAPAGRSRAARAVRASGYLAVLAVLVAKVEVGRSGSAPPAGRAALAGAWAGEIVFLVLVAAYLAGMAAMTARRQLAGPPALAAGTLAGLVAGLLMYLLPPLGTLLHIGTAWVADVYRAGRGLALLLAMAAVVAAGWRAARLSTGRGSRLPLADVRARQGLAAGLCAGGTAALVAFVLHTGTIAVLPHQVPPLHWVFTPAHPGHGPHFPPLDKFEAGAADTAAGYLLMLVAFPVLGAGLGAWGGLCAAGRPGRPPGPGGGGGGGGGEPQPAPPPPPGGARQPAILRGYLHELPPDSGLSGPGPAAPDTERPVRAPAQRRGPARRAGAGTAGTARCATSRRTPVARSG
jgi:hypothetical protein